MKITIEILHFEFTVICSRKKGNKAPDNRKPAAPFAEEAVREIENPKRTARPSTVTNERTALNSFVSYFGREATLADITSETIKGFEARLAERGIAPITSACYMRSLRAVINRLGGDGKELFAQVNTNRRRTVKKAVREDVVEKLESLDIPENTREAYARDTFLLSFYAMGMPLVDMTGLSADNLRGEHIIYHRHKTGEEVSVLITPKIRQLLDRYRREDSPYLMPFLTAGKDIESYNQYQSVLNRTNRWLHHLTDGFGLPKITSYTARHSWATIASRKGVDIYVISKALGHTNLLTTLNYIKETDYDKVDSACLMIQQSIRKPKSVA